MKHLLVILFLLFKLNVQSQEVLFTPEWNYQSFFVLRIDEEQKYKKTLRWLKSNHDAELVVKHKISNRLLIVDGTVPNFFHQTINNGKEISYTLKFTVEISMNDSRYAVKYIHNYFLLANSDSASIDFGKFIIDQGDFKESADNYKLFTREFVNSLFKVFQDQ